MQENELLILVEKWTEILRIKNNWDIKLELLSDPSFRKTGDIKIDCDDRKAILILNQAGPNCGNPEEIICHELLHLKQQTIFNSMENSLPFGFTSGVRDTFTVLRPDIRLEYW